MCGAYSWLGIGGKGSGTGCELGKGSGTGIGGRPGGSTCEIHECDALLFGTASERLSSCVIGDQCLTTAVRRITHQQSTTTTSHNDQPTPTITNDPNEDDHQRLDPNDQRPPTITNDHQRSPTTTNDHNDQRPQRSPTTTTTTTTTTTNKRKTTAAVLLAALLAEPMWLTTTLVLLVARTMAHVLSGKPGGTWRPEFTPRRLP